MSRDRRRNREPKSVVKITPEINDVLKQQLASFKEKFGREPSGSDPIFFDPDADVPTPMSPGRMKEEVATAMRKAGIDQAKIDVFLKVLG